MLSNHERGPRPARDHHPVRARPDLRRHLRRGRRHPVQAPRPGDPLPLVQPPASSTTRPEPSSRSFTVSDTTTSESPGDREDTRGGVDREAACVVADELDLAPWTPSRIAIPMSVAEAVIASPQRTARNELSNRAKP